MSLTLFIAAASTVAAAPSVSGVYVGASADTVQLIQIIRTPDGRLEGRLEEVTLKPDGAIKDDTAALEGAADGEQVVLTQKSVLTQGEAASMTGFVSGDLLDLSWRGGHRTLERGDAYSFEAAVIGLKARSDMIIAENDRRIAAAKRATDIGSVLSAEQTLADEVGGLQRDLPGIEDRLMRVQTAYRDLQMKVSHDRHRANAIGGETGMGLAAMRAGTDAQAADVQLGGLHGQTVGFRSEVSLRFSTARTEVSSIALACKALAWATEPQVTAACHDVTARVSALDEAASSASAAFDAAEAVYQHPAEYVPPGRAVLQHLFGG